LTATPPYCGTIWISPRSPPSAAAVRNSPDGPGRAAACVATLSEPLAQGTTEQTENTVGARLEAAGLSAGRIAPNISPRASSRSTDESSRTCPRSHPGQGGCPTGGDWTLPGTGIAIDSLDNGNFADQNGDGLAYFKVNDGQTKKHNGVASFTWKDNTNPV
jgi:hypothetical protein